MTYYASDVFRDRCDFKATRVGNEIPVSSTVCTWVNTNTLPKFHMNCLIQINAVSKFDDCIDLIMHLLVLYTLLVLHFTKEGRYVE